MADFLRVQDGVAVEHWSEPQGFTIDKCFTPAVAATFHPMGSASIGWTWDGTKFSAPPAPPAPTASDYAKAVQALVDATAVSKQFDDGVTLAGYYNSTNATWSAQAKTFVAWRDAVWAYVIAQQAAVQAGTVIQPTIAQLIAGITPIVWPS
jgi:hypothetical protein